MGYASVIHEKKISGPHQIHACTEYFIGFTVLENVILLVDFDFAFYNIPNSSRQVLRTYSEICIFCLLQKRSSRSSW